MSGAETHAEGSEGVVPAVAPRAENRTIHRIPVRLAVSQKGRSAPLGRTRDLSLQGLFIETREPLGVGAILPLSIELEQREVIEVRAEVMRCTEDGMGLRFRDLSRDASRALRRWIVAHTSVAGDRKQVEQLHESSAKIEPIRDPVRIQSLLADIRASRERVTLVFAERSKRAYARLVEVSPKSLVFELEQGESPVEEGEDAYVLLTLAFVSYSFSLSLVQRRGQRLVTSIPSMIVFSERRTRERREAPPGSVIRWPSGVVGGQDEAEFRLVDISDHGLAFAAPHGALLMVGTPLEGASILIHGRRTVLQNAEIRNLRLIEDTTGSWVRVGVAFGTSPVGRVTRTTRRAQPTSRFGRFFERVRTLVSVVFQRGRQRILGNTDTAQRVVLRSGALPLVGLLDRTTDEPGRLAAPLVIIVPGFAGRKEQMAFLAGILVEGFQRQNADIAVLRLDGTNNLGESGKDPECRGDGMHTLHYTISGVIDDLATAVAWAKKNPLVDPSHIVIVSVSMGSIGVRQYLTRPDATEVSLWVSFMGAPDAIDAIRNVSGNIDLHSYVERGEKLGIVSLAGVLTDGDHFWEDMRRLSAASLDDSKRDMAKIRSDVVWLRGRYDAFMDPRRVDAVMSVPSSGAREIIDVESGHLPRTGAEAVAQFLGLTERIWAEVADRPFGRFTPSIGRLAMKAETEWKSVRREPLTDRAEWWRSYLLDEQGPGFDILEYAPSYVEFMDISAARTLEAGPDIKVLELGAGTGNLTRRLLERGATVTAVDLVPEALDVLRGKCAPHSPRLETAVVDLEGSALLAFRRFARGDLPNLAALSERVPGFPRKLADELSLVLGDELYAVLRGFDVKHDVRTSKLSQRAELLVRDCAIIARAADGRLPIAEARAQLRSLPESTLDGARGLEQPDGSVSAVALSLVVSYLQHPEDIISEAFRVLKRGGRLVLSSLVRDSESSQLYLGIIKRLETLPASELPPHDDPDRARASLISAARRFVDHGADLLRLEEEGLFRFYDADELERLVVLRGFEKVQVDRTFGIPPQAVIITCIKP